MDSASVKDKVIEIVSEKLKKPKEQITLESSFQDLGADSLDTADLVMEFEDEFDINIPDDEVRSVRNVRDMCAGVERLVAAKSAGAQASQ